MRQQPLDDARIGRPEVEAGGRRDSRLEDAGAMDFIGRYSQKQEAVREVKEERTLFDCILEGRREEGVRKTREALEKSPALTIVDEQFVPALNAVGERYERGEIFLPQLMRSAEVVKAAFDVIRDATAQAGASESKGAIVIATVEGDVHDIGKNIARMMLENYGYDVHDLGKDVKPESVVEAARETGARLVGLSALMTTTLGGIRRTIEALRENKLPCRVMVGGAVLSEEYARMVGADYYAKDARAGVRIAAEVYPAQPLP